MASAVMAAQLIAGCGEGNSSSPATPPSSPPAADSAPKPSETPAPSTATPAVTPPTPSATATPAPVQNQDVVQVVSAALDKYKTEKGKNAESLDELVKAGYLKEIPAAPAGKKLMYDPQKPELKLVDQ